MSDAQDKGREQDERMPDDDDLVAPSTEADPGEEPKAKKPDDPKPDHEAVGIGVVGGPQIDPDQGA
ncbi:hypothetical protein [Microbacterium sp. P01]|uniref:hypothetical protein n=1 Tax=unclassified Microbacterium TaxID=2609290 RepID=UPI00367086B5